MWLLLRQPARQQPSGRGLRGGMLPRIVLTSCPTCADISCSQIQAADRGTRCILHNLASAHEQAGRGSPPGSEFGWWVHTHASATPRPADPAVCSP